MNAPLPGDMYWLIEHSSLHEVLALVNAREDVREMVAEEPPPCSFYDTEPMPNVTTRSPRAA